MSISKFVIGLIVLFFHNTSIFAQIERGSRTFVFEPKNISTDSVEFCAVFSRQEREVYFARSNQKWGKGDMKSSIYYAVKKNGIWSTPETASFSGLYDDSDPHLTRDGNTLYFISKRPSEGIPTSADIRMVEKDDTGKWGEPIILPDPLNSRGREYSPRTDIKGNLYFASDRPGGYGQGDLYISLIKNNRLSPPLNMGNSINSSTGEWNLEINYDGDLLIFEASQRKQNISSYGDLYISFKRDYTWTIPQNITELNTSGSDLYPYLTKDERHLYYTSSDSLKGQSTNIYFTEEFKTIYDKYRKSSILIQN